MMENKLKDFFVKFFESLNCKVKISEDSIIVSEVPKNFEKFSGKISPYYFSFDKEKEGYDFVSPNFYIIKSMKEFLEGKGETTLLKVETSFNPKEDIPNLIPFRNCSIKSVSKSSRNDYFFRFTFLTNIQYLNEKEQFKTEICLRGGEIILIDEGLEFLEGDKRNLKEVRINEEYEIAKSKLKEIILPKLNKCSLKLNDLLQKEISRIKLHYQNHAEEINQQKESLKKQLSNNPDEERLKRIEKSAHKFNEENNSDKFREEEELFVQHEVKKHTLNVKNKLINISVVYFPIYTLNLVLNSVKENRMIQLEYDSLKKELSGLNCTSCKGVLNEVILCSSGHTTCRNCGEKCEVCDGIICKSCNEMVCNFCNKKICSACAEICPGCKKTFCKNHIHNANSLNKKLCKDCIQRCHSCREIIAPNSGKKIGFNLFCEKCYSKEKGKSILRDVFSN